MKSILADNWWAFVLRGVLAALFGVLAFVMPGMALLTLVLLFGVYSLAEGVFNIAAAIRKTDPAQRPWWLLLIEGLVSIAAGLCALFVPGLTGLALLYLIAAWAIVTGLLRIVAAIQLRKQIEHEWMLALAGALSIAFGVLAARFPGAGALAVVLWIGAFAIASGALLIGLGIRLKAWGGEPKRGEVTGGRPVPVH
jgi:uncharacterized membrane protein HdeD (DUF308 family)